MIAIRYAAGSLDCRLNVVVPVPVVVKHMAVATLFLRTCIKNDYSPDGGQSQGLEPNDWPKLNENDGIDAYRPPTFKRRRTVAENANELGIHLNHSKNRPGRGWGLRRGADCIRSYVEDINCAALHHVDHVATGDRSQPSHVAVWTRCQQQNW